MKKAGDILKVLMERIESEKGTAYRQSVQVFREWDRIVGEKLAAHSTVRDLENGFLVVDIDHPGWLQLLQMKEREIVNRIRKFYPELELKGLKLYIKTIDNAK
jgi:predicted nucleic acid-binding Zn ribbon protein